MAAAAQAPPLPTATPPTATPPAATPPTAPPMTAPPATTPATAPPPTTAAAESQNKMSSAVAALQAELARQRKQTEHLLLLQGAQAAPSPLPSAVTSTQQ
eukprot:2027773-Pleurochrysis_carterae.AAC.1